MVCPRLHLLLLCIIRAAQRVTNETFRTVSDPRWHPSGTKIIATKWYTSSRSIGAGEGWEWAVQSLRDLQEKTHHVVATGAGRRLIGRNLPLGWPEELYGEQQVGPEQFIWHKDDSLIYSMNIVDRLGTFNYGKGSLFCPLGRHAADILEQDVHKGIYALFQRNLTTRRTTTLVSAYPGGASRPELSRDSKTVAFVRRVRDKEVLVLK